MVKNKTEQLVDTLVSAAYDDGGRGREESSMKLLEARAALLAHIDRVRHGAERKALSAADEAASEMGPELAETMGDEELIDIALKAKLLAAHTGTDCAVALAKGAKEALLLRLKAAPAKKTKAKKGKIDAKT
jgi:hypothetical protein